MKLTEAFDSIASRRVVMFGGKGGAGKTTISSLAALHYSKTRRVILFTTDPASNLEDLFSSAPFEIEAVDAEKLYARFLDDNLANLLEIGDRGTYLDREELRRFFELSLPGIDAQVPAEAKAPILRVVQEALQNVRKHGFEQLGPFIDPLTSARRFAGWNMAVSEGPEPDPFPSRKPRTWLLGEGWSTRGGGLLSPSERPV